MSILVSGLSRGLVVEAYKFRVWRFFLVGLQASMPGRFVGLSGLRVWEPDRIVEEPQK